VFCLSVIVLFLVLFFLLHLPPFLLLMSQIPTPLVVLTSPDSQEINPPVEVPSSPDAPNVHPVSDAQSSDPPLLSVNSPEDQLQSLYNFIRHPDPNIPTHPGRCPMPPRISSSLANHLRRAYASGRAQDTRFFSSLSPFTPTLQTILWEYFFLGQDHSSRPFAPTPTPASPVPTQATPAPAFAPQPQMEHSAPFSSHRVPKAKAPESFTGDRRKCEDFISHLSLYLSTFPSATDQEKLTTAITCLSGTALTWAKGWIHPSSGAIHFKSLQHFLQLLQDTFGDPDTYATAERDLYNLKHTASCTAYYSKFSSLVALLGWSDQAQLISLFKRGLKDQLKDSLVDKSPPVKTLHEFALFCCELDSKNFSRYMEKRHFAPTQRFSQGDPMQVDSLQMTKEQRIAYRTANNLCRYCGDAQHQIDNCPKLKAKKPSINATMASSLSPTAPAFVPAQAPALNVLFSSSPDSTKN